MQSVESGQDVMNHPTNSSHPRGYIGLRVGSETKPDSPRSKLDLSSAAGFAERNSPFSSVTLAERERLGAVKY